ncbi:MAG: Fe-S-containing hydro-lyase [Candidatus Hydrothermales bacterium]
MATRKIRTPLDEETVLSIKSGDIVYISGVIYAARDAAHKRMVEEYKEKGTLPIDLKGQVIYYVGPSPEKPGQIIGSAGPTTSLRMDLYTPFMLEMGVKATIGKGERSQEVIEAMKKFVAIYLVAVGGAGALLAKVVKRVRVISYEDLGPEAIRELEVEDFPTVCAIDAYGNNLFEEGVKKFSKLS